jgi:hypothetical protein
LNRLCFLLNPSSIYPIFCYYSLFLTTIFFGGECYTIGNIFKSSSNALLSPIIYVSCLIGTNHLYVKNSFFLFPSKIYIISSQLLFVPFWYWVFIYNCLSNTVLGDAAYICSSYFLLAVMSFLLFL